MRALVRVLLVFATLGGGAAWSLTAVRPGADFAKPASIPYPAENPYTAAKAKLGAQLFFEPLLSRSRTLSCASCHLPGLSWGDGRARAMGEGHADLALRTPTLIDVAFFDRLGWDGKFKSLESVAFTPLTAPGNMGMSEPDIVTRLNGVAAYRDAFAIAFDGAPISRRAIEQALATYERSIVSYDAPFDRWAAGDEGAVDAAAKRGFALFNGKARCSACHSGWTFSDGSFHDIGTATGADVGRGRYFPTSVKLRYAFKTPTLRDVARRGPYMHDGSVPTLEKVVDLYDRGGVDRPSRSEDIRPLGLSADEKNDLVAFLTTLTGAPVPVEVPVLPR